MADPTKAWDRAFTSGSKVMQDRLKSVHAKNPAFQSWLKSSGHGAGESVKQASKEIKQTVRAKQLAAKSATAYGATKGLAVGGEHGGAGIAQKADKGKVWSPDEVAALNKQRGTEPVELTPAQKRMAAIKAAAEKSVAKKAKSFDVPTLQRQHDDLRDVHDSLHSKVTRSSMDEEVESVNEDQAADWQKVQSMEKGSMIGGKDAMKMHLKYLNAVHAHQKKHGLDTAKTKKKIEGINRTLVQMDEEVELDEMDKSQPSSSRGAEGLALGKKANPVKPDKVKSDALKILQKQYKKVKEEVELEEGKYASTIAAIAAQAYEPKVGDKVRTRKGGQIPGKVEKIEGNKVFFRHPEGKLYATHSSNLMREEVELEEAKYFKTAYGYAGGSKPSGGTYKHPERIEKLKKLLYRDRSNVKEFGKGAGLTAAQKAAARKAIANEEVELEEGKIAKALAVGAMSLASMGAKAHTDTTKSVAQLAAERPALAQRLKDIGATGQVPASDKRAAELQRKQDQEMPASERRAKELKKEEAEQIEEVTKKEAEAALGGEVKTRSANEPKGKLPYGFRRARNLARKAMRAGKSVTEEK
jgi:hypothetical protein